MNECRCGCGRPVLQNKFRGLSSRCYLRLWRAGELERYPSIGKIGRPTGRRLPWRTSK
jgi:hypothetical protein